MITLCLFTNCHKGCLIEPTIFRTLRSFKKTFGEPEKLEIYCDPNPNHKDYDEYAREIEKQTGIKPIKTTGLDNGWLTALNTATTPYLFMLEADWRFYPEFIKHSLREIEQMMSDNNLWFLLFNKHKNDTALNGTKWQTYFKPTEKDYCLSDRFSNNPNILEVEYFKKHIVPKVDWTIGGAGRIEQVLQRKVDITVYGKYGNQPTIRHLNGRRGGKK